MSQLRLSLRLPTIAFFFLTSWFGLLSYVPFAYLQFLRHHLFSWLEFFVASHQFLYWAALLLGMLSVSDDLAGGRRAAWIMAGVFGAYGIWQLWHPVLPTLIDDRRSLVVGLAALTVPVGFAWLDHLATQGRVAWDGLGTPLETALRRGLVVCGAATAYLWVVFSAIAGYRLYQAADPRLNALDFMLAVAWSFPQYLAVGAGVFAFLAAIFAGTRSPRLRYALIVGGVCGVIWLVLVRVVFPAIAFRGGLAALMAAAIASSAGFVSSGLVLRQAADISQRRSTAKPALIALALLPIIAFMAVEGVEKVDWYFLLQKLVAFAIWLAVFASIGLGATTLRSAPRRPARLAAIVMAASLLIVFAHALAPATRAMSRLTLAEDRYAAYEPSLMLLDSALSPASTDLADLTSFVIANSNIVRARPASVDFVARLERSQTPLPHIFLFVVDSLRRDYLSPYNHDVRFTPFIDAFARENLTFTRAFTRYGGTGLSEPALWSGALLPHKEYVTPFAPMNALEKLVAANDYHRLISVDSILRQLLTPSAMTRELDAGIQNRQYEMCRTLSEVRAVLPDVVRDGRPVFVFTQPQDVHLANVAIDRERRPAGAYDGFYPPYAARLERLDACFGGFITYLKDAGLYENSVIVLTSDHGDSLGDEGRWGHAYTVFPEVMRVPLIVHVPSRGHGGFTTDTDTVAFTTDITPTLYRLLGYQPVDREPLFGVSLIGAEAGALARRRERSYLVASSYGPVYGILADNAQELYIIDGVNTAEHRYDLRQGPNGEATMITPAERADAAREIRMQVQAIAEFYGVEPVSK